MKHDINLIPAYRLAARKRHHRIRAWSIGCVAYALSLVFVCICSRILWGKDLRVLAGEVEYLGRQIGELNSSIKTERSKLTEVAASVQILKTITEQPDWSILLGILGIKIGEDTVLSSIRLEPATGTSVYSSANSAHSITANHGIQPSQFNLELQGHARTQSAVSQLMQRLQETGLFSEVKLVRSGREQFAGNEAFAFHLQCFLGGGGGRTRR